MFQSLDMPPGRVDGFLWADFAELRAAIHADQCFSRGDLDGVARRAKDRGQGFHSEDRWRLITNFVATRVAEFGDAYPFSVSDDGDTVSLELGASPLKRLYLSLLMASCMRHIVDGRKSEVARTFEETCFQVFSRLMPPGSEIRATWANGGPEAPYRGTLFEKMKAVANDIRCTANFKEGDFKRNDTGDGGIDLIAWHPMSDRREGIPIAFAQCGCSRDDWRFKQLEASPSKHRRNLPAMHLWATYYFLPLDLRQVDGDWAYKSDIGEAIIVDRMRLVRLAAQYELAGHLPEMPFIDEAIREQIPI